MDNREYEFKNKLMSLLSYATTREKAIKATKLITDNFGCSLSLFDIPIEIMSQKLNLSEHICILIKLIPDLARVYELSKIKGDLYLNSKADWEDYFKIRLLGRNVEQILMGGIDKNKKFLGCVEISLGENRLVVVSMDKVLQFISLFKPKAVAIAHNHPNGIEKPSHSDIVSTKRLRKVLASSNIELVEHFVVAGNRVSRIFETIELKC